MKSRRDSILILCIVLIAAILAGCGAAEQRPALERIEYTNLNDSGSRELLKELLSEIGVSDERIQGFFRRVGRFNDSVKQVTAVSDGAVAVHYAEEYLAENR